MKRLIAPILLFAAALSLSAQAKPIITVLDLKTDGISVNEMHSVISLLSSALFKTGRYIVIDVTQRETLLKELEFSSSGCSDESCQLQVGRLLSAQLIVVGNIGKLGNKVVLSVKVLETETAATKSTADGIYADMDALLTDFPNLAGELSGQPAKAVETPKAPSAQPQPAAKPAAAGPSWKLIGAIGCLLGGLGSTGYGAYSLIDAFSYEAGTLKTSYNAYQTAGLQSVSSFDRLYDDYLSKFATYQWKLSWGIGMASGGAVLTGISVLLFLLPEAPTSAPQASLTIRPERATVGLSFRY
jgi:hypothetical protein